MKKISPELNVKRYHALINRIAQSAKVNITPDELISSLHLKEWAVVGAKKYGV